MKRLVLSLLLCSIVYGAPESPEWKIIKPKYPVPDTIVAGYNVLDFGAKGDGQTDCTDAFQEALNRMRSAGGGTVFVPEGRYVIKGTLRVPVSVTLRGEWAAPTSEDPTVRGTVLMVYAGRGSDEGTPFMSVDYCGGVKDMSFWYPAQNPKEITPYPYCLIQKGGDNATFENLTLVNAYQGIRIGPGGNELHYVHNVYGTPLKVGIRYDSTTDIGRLENVHFSPDYWCKSGLAGAPSSSSDFAGWLLSNGTAVHMERSDWEYVSYVFIEGYLYGYLITNGARGSANAQFYNLVIHNCQTAVEVQETNPYGMVFTKCIFHGRDYGFRMGNRFNAAILLNDCEVSANQALYSEGTGCFITENTRVTHGNITLTGGVLAMTVSQLQDAETQITLGSNVDGVSLVGNTFAKNPPNIRSDMPAERLKVIDSPVKIEPFPQYDGNQTRVIRAAREVLYVVTDPKWGADPSGRNDSTEAFQKALKDAEKDGGGIVFAPAGDYVIRGSLSIPSGVELRGIHDVPHHTMGSGSMLHIYPGSEQKPSVTMQPRSGLRGITFNYPEQAIANLKEYPFLIRGHGDDIYIVHVNCSNAFKFLDLMTNACNRHYVDYLSGSPLRIGIAVGGGSVEGEIRNVQFNPHYWSRCDRGNPFFRNSSGGRRGGPSVWGYQKENLDAIWVGNCKRELLFQNFVYGSLYGIHFSQQEGQGPEDCFVHGHGTDGSKVGVFFEQGSGRIDMVNSELVAMSSQDKVAIKLGADFEGTARLINTMVWGDPSTLAQVDNGKLRLLGLHAFRHGNGLQIHNGEVTAVNVNFFPRGNHLSLAEKDAKATLIGNITRGALVVNDQPTRDDAQIPNVTTLGNLAK